MHLIGHLPLCCFDGADRALIVQLEGVNDTAFTKRVATWQRARINVILKANWAFCAAVEVIALRDEKRMRSPFANEILVEIVDASFLICHWPVQLVPFACWYFLTLDSRPPQKAIDRLLRTKQGENFDTPYGKGIKNWTPFVSPFPRWPLTSAVTANSPTRRNDAAGAK